MYRAASPVEGAVRALSSLFVASATSLPAKALAQVLRLKATRATSTRSFLCGRRCHGARAEGATTLMYAVVFTEGVCRFIEGKAKSDCGICIVFFGFL